MLSKVLHVLPSFNHSFFTYLREDECSVKNILTCALITLWLTNDCEECRRSRNKLPRKSECSLQWNISKQRCKRVLISKKDRSCWRPLTSAVSTTNSGVFVSAFSNTPIWPSVPDFRASCAGKITIILFFPFVFFLEISCPLHLIKAASVVMTNRIR